MEFVFSELLSRDEILRILSERQLQIADMERLTECELLRIYKTFAMPRARRERRQLRHCHNAMTSSNNNNTVNEHEMIDSIPRQASDSTIEMDTDPHETVTQHQLHLVGEKRPCYDDNAAEDFLSTATKRIKINWS